MRLYCLCKLAPTLNQVVGVTDAVVPHTKVVITQRMTMQECGAEQYLGELGTPASDGSPQFATLRRHYPNVDIYVCPNCGSLVCHE